MNLFAHSKFLQLRKNYSFPGVYKILVIIFCFFSFSGCKPNSTGEIPAYLYIPVPEVITLSNQGTASHAITDAWVYVDNELLGVYELPAHIPVIAEGLTQIEVSPGIKLNGISATRAVNPFYQSDPVTHQIDLMPAQTDTLLLEFIYRNAAVFLLNEDFESGNSFQGIERITGAGSEIYEGNASGKIVVDTVFDRITARTTDFYDLPGGGTPVFVEINYKSSAILVMGLSFMAQGFEQDFFILGLNRRDEWNKIYINITPQATESGGGQFRLIFRADLPAGMNEAEVLLDNIKIVHL